MDWTAFYPYFQNASLLLLLSVILEAIYLIPQRLRRVRLVVLGVLSALICIAIMTVPYTLLPGLWFDTRSILISVTALAFGPIPTAITVFAALLYRMLLGGVGMVPGLAVIVSCAAIGLGWRRYLYPRLARYRWLNVFLMSMTVHVVMLGCMLLLPYPNSLTVIRSIAPPVLTIYPLTAAMLSLLLMRQQETHRLQENLKQSEERFRALFDQAPLGYQSLNSRRGCGRRQRAVACHVRLCPRGRRGAAVCEVPVARMRGRISCEIRRFQNQGADPLRYGDAYQRRHTAPHSL